MLAIIFFGLTLPILISGTADRNEVEGLIGFWLLGIALTVIPSFFSLEVGDNYVRGYLFGLQIRETRSSDVEVLEYGNLFKGGLGYGKGLKGWQRTKRGRSYFSIGENFWGKAAIEDARRALEKRGAKAA